jgi:histidinol phosphatase-like PHP family hydrolase
MIDLHMHTLFSDGELIPSELARRAAVAGYRAMAITDHADHSNFDFILSRVSQVCGKVSEAYGIFVLPGIEITHVPPRWIPALAKEARKAGARVIVVHGETPVEPVVEGTNLAAVQSDIDILAHPGLIDEDSVKLATKAGICLEISTRKGHSLGNGHVAAMARKHGALLVVNTDTHSPGDLVSREFARTVARGAGMTEAETARAFRNSEEIVRRLTSARAAAQKPRKRG